MAFLWEEVLQRDSFLDILACFVHVMTEEKSVRGKKIRKETMIFPRYHQLDAVRHLVGAIREDGAGQNYLVQHSAGSGKSNSIAWLAHRLGSLHDKNDEKVYDSVIVVTDRRVLDQQLQNTIYQFDHKQGVVQKIDVDSAQLAQALSAGVPIIVTTLQKFPFVTEKMEELPEKFATDEYQLLLVAEKYQTGFDQPLLHTMYVDKRLSGVQAVQTLSRLNRTHPGKENTFVLDFVNDMQEIQDSFQPYYEQPAVGEQAEARQLYDLQARLDAAQVYHRDEVLTFAQVFYKPKTQQAAADHARMNACLDPAVARFRALGDDEQEEFLNTLTAFRNLYGFLSQVIPFQDSDLEKLYSYVRFLIGKLPRDRGPRYLFDDEVTLKFYRLQKISEGAIDLEKEQPGEVSGPTQVGTGASHDEV